jgi:catechol 2,3-dioxygenase-like lactoylglutathione lyase family enzyme
MKLENVVPMMTVADLDATLHFYREILGFECVNHMEGWAVVQKDSVELMFRLPNEHVPFEKPMFTGSFYFRHDDVDALWLELKDNARIVYPIETFHYGMREFAILDNNGYCLQFGKEVG